MSDDFFFIYRPRVSISLHDFVVMFLFAITFLACGLELKSFAKCYKCGSRIYELFSNLVLLFIKCTSN